MTSDSSRCAARTRRVSAFTPVSTGMKVGMRGVSQAQIARGLTRRASRVDLSPHAGKVRRARQKPTMMTHGDPTYPPPPPSSARACSAIRSPGSRICRWSPATAAMPATSTFRISCICAWCARPMPMAASCRSTPRRRWRCRAWSRCGPMPTSPISRRSISAPTSPPRRSSRFASRRWRATACAISAIRWRRCSPRIRISPRTRPSWSRSRSRRCRWCCRRAIRPASSSPAAAARPRCSATATATSRRRCAPRTPSSSSISRPAGTPACRWRPAARIGRYDAARDHPGIARRRQDSPSQPRDLVPDARAAARRRCTCMKAMSAAASASAARSIPRTCWCCSRRCGCGRPVKWIEDRREHLMCANQSRQQRHLARIAVDQDGLILGIEDEIFHDQGAYIRTHGVNVPNRTMCMLTGAYRVPAYRALAHVRLTNKTPAATYRAPGRFESTFVRSRLMDAVADRLGLDRIEVRRRNLIAASRDALHHRVRRARRRGAGARFRRLRGAARQGAHGVRLGGAAAGAGTPPRRRRGGRRRGRDLSRGERARARPTMPRFRSTAPARSS